MVERIRLLLSQFPGNSAGQATVYLASQASKVWLFVRGSDLASSMSRYLVDRIAGLSNVEVLTQTGQTGSLSGSVPRRATGEGPGVRALLSDRLDWQKVECSNVILRVLYEFHR